MKIVVANDTADIEHFGSFASMNALRTGLNEHDIIGVLHKNYLNYDNINNAINNPEDIAGLIKRADILLINGETAFQSAQAPELECLIDLAIENSIPFALVNAVFRDYAFFADRFRQAEFMTLRDDRSVDEARALGLPAVRCVDAALYATFDPLASYAKRSGTIAADWQPETHRARLIVQDVLAKGGSFLSFVGRHAIGEWPRLINLLAQYEYCVCGGYRGALFSILAGNNARFFDADTDEVAQLMGELGLTHRGLSSGQPGSPDVTTLLDIHDIMDAREVLLSWQNNPELHPLASLKALPRRRPVHMPDTAEASDGAVSGSCVHCNYINNGPAFSRNISDRVKLMITEATSVNDIMGFIRKLEAININESFEFSFQESSFDACLFFVRVMFERGELDSAHRLIARLLSKQPDLPGALPLAGAISFHLHHSELSALYYERADALNELDGSSLAVFARASGRTGRHGEKTIILERSIRSRGRTKPALVELARSAAAAGDLIKAQSLAAEAAISDTSELTFQQELDLGNLLAATGHFADGFSLMASGWRRSNIQFQTILDQRHQPTSREEYLFVPDEIGVGSATLSSCFLDTVDFGKSLTVILDRRLHNIFQRSFPEVRVMDMQVFLESKERGVCTDLFNWIGSRTNSINVESKSAKLFADPEEVKRVKERYKKRFPGRKLTGLAWFTPNPRSGSSRNIPINEIRRIIDENSDTIWISLQPSLAYALRSVAAFSRQNVFVDTEIDPIRDIDMQIAQIAALDDVRSIDCSAALFAGAIGKPTECYLNYPPTWQWPHMRSWYDSVRCITPSDMRSPYRQSAIYQS